MYGRVNPLTDNESVSRPAAFSRDVASAVPTSPSKENAPTYYNRVASLTRCAFDLSAHSLSTPSPDGPDGPRTGVRTSRYTYNRARTVHQNLSPLSRGKCHWPCQNAVQRRFEVRRNTSRGACPAPFVRPPVARRVAPRRSMARARGQSNWTTGDYRNIAGASIIASERHAKALRSLDFEARTGALLAPSRLRCRRTTTTRPRLLQSRSIWPPSPRLHRYRREKPP
jgi:hypothetical protein